MKLCTGVDNSKHQRFQLSPALHRATGSIDLIGRMTRRTKPAPMANSAERTPIVRSRRTRDTPAAHEIKTIALISKVLKSASTHPSRLTDCMMRDARPLAQPRASSPAKNSPRGNSLAIRNTEPRAIISFKCAITVMSRLAVSLAGRSSPDNGRAFLEPQFLNEALHRRGQQQTPALSAFTGAT